MNYLDKINRRNEKRYGNQCEECGSYIKFCTCIKKKTSEELIYELLKLCIDITEKVDQLEENNVFDPELKSKAEKLSKICQKRTDRAFKNNPDMVKFYDMDTTFIHKMSLLSPIERHSVTEFVDKLKATKR